MHLYPHHSEDGIPKRACALMIAFQQLHLQSKKKISFLLTPLALVGEDGSAL